LVDLKIGYQSHLSGLTAAVYILKCFSKGYSKQYITNDLFKGDEQLVSKWIDFLKDIRWLREGARDTKFIVSENGKKWMKRYDFALNCINHNKYL
jgi:hypothetical protein